MCLLDCIFYFFFRRIHSLSRGQCFPTSPSGALALCNMAVRPKKHFDMYNSIYMTTLCLFASGCTFPSTSYVFLAPCKLCFVLYEATEGHLLHLLFSKLEQVLFSLCEQMRSNKRLGTVKGFYRMLCPGC